MRPIAMKDASRIAKLVNDREIAEKVSHIPYPYDVEDARRWIRGLGDERVFVIIRRFRLIGCVGLNPKSQTSCELGYWIGRKWWGRGYATEAAAAVLPIAFTNPAVVLVTSAHFKDNPESGNVLYKLGFSPAGEGLRWCEARGQKIESVEFRLTRMVFEANRKARASR